MEPGFIADASQAAFVQERWSSGAPQASFWGGVKVNRSELLPVTTYRCTNCGYLESYAK